MKKYIKVLIGIGVVCVVVFSATPSTQAAVFRSGEHIVVAPEQTVPGDFYTAGNDVYIAGTVEGDVFALGGSVIIKGMVKGDVLALGGSIAVDGEVTGSVRVIGGKTTLSQKIGKDAVVVASTLAVMPSAHVFGTVYAYTEKSDITGPVEGAVIINTHTLTLNAKATSVDATLTGLFSLGPQAQIKKDVVYTSSEEVSRAPESVVEGSIYQQEAPQIASSRGITRGMLLIFCMSLFSALVLVLLAKNILNTLFVARIQQIGLSALLGVGSIIATPIAALVLCLTLVGMPLGILTLCAYGIGMVLALSAAPVFVGAYIAKLSGKGYAITWAWTTLGVVIMNVLLFIPVVGVLAVGAVSVLLFGMMVLHIYHLIRLG